MARVTVFIPPLSSHIASVYLLEWHEWHSFHIPPICSHIASVYLLEWHEWHSSLYHPFLLILLPSICWNDMSDTVPYTTHYFWYRFRLSVGMTWVTQFPYATHFFWYCFRLSVGMTQVTQFPYHPFLLISLSSICWNDMSDTVSIYHPFLLISLPSICWNDMSDTVSIYHPFLLILFPSFFWIDMSGTVSITPIIWLCRIWRQGHSVVFDPRTILCVLHKRMLCSISHWNEYHHSMSSFFSYSTAGWDVGSRAVDNDANFNFYNITMLISNAINWNTA